MAVDKVSNGGIYLIDLKGFVSPEFGYNHYCILLKTSLTDLYFAFPITTSENRKNEKYTIQNFIDGEGYILLYQAKPISKNRIISEKKRDGLLVLADETQSDKLFDEYLKYINDIKQNNNLSIKQIHKNIQKSKTEMVLNCVTSYTLFVNDKLDYNSLIIEAKGGTITHSEISTKRIGTYTVSFFLRDKYGNKLTQNVQVNVINS